MHKSIEELRENYYIAVKSLNEEKDIREALPNTEYISFYSIISYVINKLKIDIDDLKDMLNSNIDNDLKDYIQEEINKFNLTINICYDLYKEAEENTLAEKEAENTTKHLIFAKSSLDNILVENDLKYIPEEYYNSLLMCLNDLEQGNDEKNPTKARPFVHNDKLNGIHEIKRFKVRVIYKILSSDLAYVMLAKMKKDDNSLIDREPILLRNKQTDNEYKMLKKNIQDESFKNKLIEENDIIKENLYELLNNGKRR